MADMQRGPEDVGTGKRMADLAKASGNALKHKMRGEQETEAGRDYAVDLNDINTLIDDWPASPKTVAEQMLKQYGAPNEATPTKLFWYRKGPWKRILVTKDVVVYNFPMPHSDFITQYIDYRVPVEKFDEIARMDGSCLVDRTSGEVGARCDSEWANIITLNMMHEIVTGRKTVEDARKTFAESAAAYSMGREAPYAERLQFEVSQEETGDPDEAIIGGAMARQMAGKAKDMLTGRS